MEVGVYLTLKNIQVVTMFLKAWKMIVSTTRLMLFLMNVMARQKFDWPKTASLTLGVDGDSLISNITLTIYIQFKARDMVFVMITISMHSKMKIKPILDWQKERTLKLMVAGVFLRLKTSYPWKWNNNRKKPWKLKNMNWIKIWLTVILKMTTMKKLPKLWKRWSSNTKPCSLS